MDRFRGDSEEVGVIHRELLDMIMRSQEHLQRVQDLKRELRKREAGPMDRFRGYWEKEEGRLMEKLKSN